MESRTDCIIQVPTLSLSSGDSVEELTEEQLQELQQLEQIQIVEEQKNPPEQA